MNTMYKDAAWTNNATAELIEDAVYALKSTAAMMTVYMDKPEVYEAGNDDQGPFFECGLCFDYVTGEDGEDDYWRYQLAWGGPSEEIRFYARRAQAATARYIEHVYMDWNCGIAFDVTCSDWAQWLWDEFQSTGTISEVQAAAMMADDED